MDSCIYDSFDECHHDCSECCQYIGESTCEECECTDNLYKDENGSLICKECMLSQKFQYSILRDFANEYTYEFEEFLANTYFERCTDE